jgi:hypothetical protein
MVNLQLSPAEQNITKIVALVRGAKLNFLELGRLLIENQENSYHDAMKVSFKDFCEMLGVGSFSWVTRLMNVARVVAHNILTEDEVLEIGIAKTCLLLPRLKKGEIDNDIIELAKSCPYHDLRLELGYKVSEFSEEYINCPNCGSEFPFQQYMIKRR